MNDNKYKIDIRCLNCDFDGNIEIKKGTKIEDEKCPNCGCQTVIKKPIRQRMTTAQRDFR